MTPIRIESISRSFGQTVALEGVSLEIGAGEIFYEDHNRVFGGVTLFLFLSAAGFVVFRDRRVGERQRNEHKGGYCKERDQPFHWLPPQITSPIEPYQLYTEKGRA